MTLAGLVGNARPSHAALACIGASPFRNAMWDFRMTEDTAGRKMHVASANLGDELGFKRTRLAYDRTLMAWIRTATSLISFGFTIYKFFDLSGFKSAGEQQLIGPRIYAIAMILTGLGALTIAIFDHRSSMTDLASLGAEFHTPMRARRVAWLVSALGVLAMAAVVFHE
jgi:putative membrane protein